jgi:UDP-N-acetylmuramoyl-L-alanyl-D-glutamate--2,6-diaminopimelate ligase
MSTLADLVAAVPGARLVAGDPQRTVAGVRDDSRAVTAGDLFVAVSGTKSDGRQFVPAALAAGAAAVVVEPPLPDLPPGGGVAWIQVPSARKAVGLLAARHLGGPAGQRPMTLLAVTGTNGKTTTTYLLESMLSAAGRRPGVFGTVTYRYAGKAVPAPLTTPGALQLQTLLAEMKAAGTTDVAMEVTSIALDQDRVAGCRFRVAGLTNVTQDHLDYHGTMDRYFQAKTILFRELLTPDGVGVVFADREDGRRMQPHIAGRALTLSLDPAVGADVQVVDRELRERGTRLSLRTAWGPLELDSPLVGGFNVDNLCLAAGMGLGLGLGPEVVARGLAAQKTVPGRLERVDNDAGVLCVVDYAHTPDALERALQTLRPLTRGRLLVVFGCGGDRDPTKRPVMGEAAVRLGDVAIVTSDNPRTEDPGKIVQMVVEGVRRAGGVEVPVDALPAAARGYTAEVDRRTAIRRAVAAARAGDTLVIAGKGHEDYQILGTTKIHFDDREEAAAAFAARPGAHPA